LRPFVFDSVTNAFRFRFKKSDGLRFAPPILRLLKHLRKEQSLAAHYIATQGHLIGPGIEIWEFDLEANNAERLL
jgi:hypothetical protein